MKKEELLKNKIKRIIELTLNSEIEVNEIGWEYIPITGQYQRILNKLADKIIKTIKN